MYGYFFSSDSAGNTPNMRKSITFVVKMEVLVSMKRHCHELVSISHRLY